METEVLPGLDGTDILNLLNRKKNSYIKSTLSTLEEAFNTSVPPTYEVVRKLFLDSINDYTRSVERALLGSTPEG